jgi:hypothetical protein
MKSLKLLSLAALATLVACGTDLPTQSQLQADDALLNRGGAAQGAQQQVSSSVVVVGTFQIAGTAGGGFRESGPSNNGMGTCLVGGKYQNNGGNIAQNWPHEQCMNEGSEAVTVTFSTPATYVVTPSGNVNLNFGPDTHVHYQANQNRTQAAGVLLGSGSDGSSWTVSLGQLAGAGNAFAGTRTLSVEACMVGGDTCRAFTLSW